ncbi:unnamed protein product [Aspergillus oryzae]|uniref:DNA, SC005 n=3 Tax=Aspergillus oryzae TaxID=5062 RepID=Q2UPM8_ASPOR|nr:unnamed protein product [Aspergillus oryzae RIB40]BAE56487.1 unnamed protein product [Aspergillus oryzae RIB40]GMF79438.1 unnamed protein product [Aspergillus oryzae]GMF94970.1 unnamed protein product [Aspergillus oryzae]GMG31790.1 unnamed protein product [Aspergillus oryzae]
MARVTFAGLVYGRPPLLFLISVISAMTMPNHAFSLAQRDSDSCPSSYQKCGAAGLPDSFCCPSSSTCISLDNASSAICCPKGQACTYIEPINCNVQLQNATLHPTNPVKTIRLDDQLPQCGNSCCPFGYKCKGNQLCEMDNNITSTTTTGTSSTISATSTASDVLPTTDQLKPTTLSPSDPNPSASNSSMTDTNPTSDPVAAACPSFPTQAIIAGFFPGAILGAVLASAAMFCWRRRRNGPKNSHGKLPRHNSVYNSTPFSISHPIPSEESSYRTDFLLGRSHRSSSRSVLHRTGTRVKSLFGSTPKTVIHNLDNIPKVPITPPPQARRQPSTESIKVYTPPGGLPGTGTQKRGHYISMEPDKGFVEMFDRVGFMNQKGDPCFKVAESPEASRTNLQTPQNV